MCSLPKTTHAKPLVPNRPDPEQFPIDALDRASTRLEELQSEIDVARIEMGELAVKFSRAKAHLTELLRTRSFLKQDQDTALAALQAQDGHQEHQVQKVTSASKSSPLSASSAKKRPLPTGLVPQEKTKKLAAEPPPIWPKSAQPKRARHDGDH